MGILSDRDIKLQMILGRLVFDPTPPTIQPVSIDLHLWNEIIVPEGGRIIDPMLGIGVEDKPRVFDFHYLFPSQFVNVCTEEWVDMPQHLVGILCGKSTLARFGLQVESAGLVDPGWKGRLTLELKNLGPDTIILRPGMKICQMYILPIDGELPENLYGDDILNSHYQGSQGPSSGRLDRPSQGNSESSTPSPHPDD